MAISPETDDPIQFKAAGSVMAVDLLNMLVINPPTQDQMQAIADKVDEALRNGKRQ